MIREKFIDRLRKKYQQGGVRKYHEGGPQDPSTMSLDDLNAGYDQAHYSQPHHAGGNTGGDTGSMYGDFDSDGTSDLNPDGTPRIDYGFSWGNQGQGFGPIISGKGMGDLAEWGKSQWDKSGTLGKIGIGLGGAAVAGASVPVMAANWGDIKSKIGLRDGGVRHQTGGMYDQMQQYQMGGQQLPGGEMQPIPGSDAVQFNGQTHDEGGIMMDGQTEVEDGETMDQVNMAKKGGKRDYFFSSYLKTGGRSFANAHKEILANGGDQQEINMLAKMQEKAAGRDPKQVAGLGGVMEYKHGGMRKYQTGGLEEPVKPVMADFKSENGSLDLKSFLKAKRQYKKALKVYEREQENVANEVVPTQTDSIVNSTATPDYLIEDADDEGITTIAELEEQEREQEEEEREALKEEEQRLKKEQQQEKVKDLQAKAKEYNIKTPKGVKMTIGKLEELIANVEQKITDGGYNSYEELAQAEKEAKEEAKLTDIKADPNRKGTTQGQVKQVIGGKTYYVDKGSELHDAMESLGDDFPDWWMSKVDPKVLKESNINSFDDFFNTDGTQKGDAVLAYQQTYNKIHGGGQKILGEDSDLGNDTLSTAIDPVIEASIPEVEISDRRDDATTIPTRQPKLLPSSDLNMNVMQPGPTPAYTPTDDNNDDNANTTSNMFSIDYLRRQANRQIGPEGDNTLTLTDGVTGDGYADRYKRDIDLGEKNPYDSKIPGLAYAGMAAGLGAGLYSMFHKQPDAEQAGYTPGFTSPVTAYRGRAPRLERFDYNQDIANVGSEVRGMNKYIETSGGGPANMVNKMMAFSKGQTAKNQIRAAETRANVGVQNTEAQLKQQMTLDNLRRQQSASIFNAQMNRAEIARKDQVDEANTARRQKVQDDQEFQRYAGISSIADSLQTGFGDILDYKADMAQAQAIGSGTSVYTDAAKIGAGWTFAEDGITLVPPKGRAKFGGLRRLQNYNK